MVRAKTVPLPPVRVYIQYMSRVVVVKYIGDQRNRPLSQSDYEILLNSAFLTLSGNGDLQAAIRKYLPDGVVGMKPNCLAHKWNATPVPLIDALSNLLTSTGLRDKDIVVWERSNRELSASDYKLNATSTGRRCFGTDATIAGYSSDFYSFGEVNSLVTRILTEIVDVNINLPVLKDHSVAGLSGGMKNMYGAINNPNKYHADNCNPFCAHVNLLEPIRTKNRLTIIDAVRVQYNGGPGFVEDYIAYFGGIVVSDDPVAADRVGLEIIEHFRAVNGLPTLDRVERPVKYLATAEKLGLGTADMKKIDLQVLSVDKSGRHNSETLF